MSAHKTKTINAIDLKVGRKLKFRRQMMGLSQTAFGERIGVSRIKVGQYESGTSSIPSSTLFLISKIMNVDLEYFFKETEKGHPVEIIETLPPELAREAISILKHLSDIKDQNVLHEFSNVLKSYNELVNKRKS